MKTIYGIDIHDGRCGLSFSGGADSAILLYILLTNIKDTLHLYSFYSQGKAEIAEPITDRVLQKCIELSGNNNVVHHKEFIKKQTPPVIHNMLQSYIERDNLVKMYNGISKFPPDEIINTFHEKIKSESPVIYQRRKNDAVYELYFGDKQSFYRPFANFDKKDIAGLYKLLNLEQQLFSITRSCENTNSPLQHCSRCFWCEERYWGFGYLE